MELLNSDIFIINFSFCGKSGNAMEIVGFLEYVLICRIHSLIMAILNKQKRLVNS